MSTSVFLWITLAVCVRLGSCDVYYKTIGESVRMNCNAEKGSYEITWKQNSAMVINEKVKSGRTMRGNSDLGQRVRVQQTNLEIPSVKIEDSGVFTCMGTWNNLYSEHTLHVMSAFADPPHVLYGSDTTLKCDVSDKSDATYQWSGPKGQSHKKKTVEVKSLCSEDAGKWSCHITDEIGKTQKILSVDITVIGPLETKDVTINSGGNGVLPCSLPTTGHLRLQKVQWSHGSTPLISAVRSNDHDNSWNTSDCKSCSFEDKSFSTKFDLTVKKAKGDDAGLYICTLTFDNNKYLSGEVNLAVEENVVTGNGYGNGNPKTQPAKSNFWIKPVLGVGVWVWAAAGMSFLLLISLLVIIVLVYRRNKRMKMKVRRMKSKNDPLTPLKFCQCNRPVNLHPVGKRGRPTALPRHDYEHLNN